MVPSNGTALETDFYLLTENWRDDPSSYPLTYVFLYELSSGTSTILNVCSVVFTGSLCVASWFTGAIVLQARSDGEASLLEPTTGSANLTTVLPLGNEADNYSLTLSVVVADNFDAFSTRVSTITVRAAPLVCLKYSL